MRTFLINLDRDTDRLAAVKKRLDDAGVAFERVSAVYGKALSPAEKDRAVNRLRFRMAMGRDVFDGEIGCALSHVKIYRQMIQEHVPVACVLEDDVIAIGDMREALARIDRIIDVTRPQVILLSDHIGHRGLTGIARINSGMATEAYVLTMPAASALLTCLVPMRCACDLWARWVLTGAVELYGIFPAVANQAWDVFDSHIKPKRKVERSIVIRLISGVGKVIDRVLLAFERIRP